MTWKSSIVLDDPEVREVEVLSAPPEELSEISRDLALGISLEEMEEVRSYFRKIGRNPTDVELQSLGQAWSEHCCYKSSKAILRKHILHIREDKIVAREDAGVARFDRNHDYVVKIESHNHPSAVEPYGGAATGVGGVLRDVACMGAEPIALVDPLFFGPLSTPPSKIPQGAHSPLYLLSGVVAGIRDYGNRVGIPTVGGLLCFHPGFLSNVLVNVGCVGILRRGKLVHSRAGGMGDRFVLLGGRTGRDGIHGVTFASRNLGLTREEDRPSVQLGDPILKEPLLHVIEEANERGLLTGMKDLGGGGLSCASGEMALAAGVGASIHLDRVLLKEPSMKPWEIWVSESQERMLVTVRPEDVEEILEIARLWDVEGSLVGEVTQGPWIRADWKGRTVLEMEGSFLYGGPLYDRPKRPRVIERLSDPIPQKRDWTGVLLDLLSSENIASREWVVRMYDHEVKGRTILKPLQGKIGFSTHGDSCVLRPVENSWRGLAVTTASNPSLTEIDPFRGALYTVDEVARNLACVGARLDSLADNLNLGNPENPERMWEAEEVARGLGAGAQAFKAPFLSGNVSMYNESPSAPIPPTPSLLGVGIVRDLRKAVTSDLKGEGTTLVLVGKTGEEMGGSELYSLLGLRSTLVPEVDLKLAPRACEALVRSIEEGLVLSAHDVSNGGVAVAACEMAFGGDVGFDVDLGTDLPPPILLFGESPTRWVVEVRNARRFLAFMESRGVPARVLGRTGGRRIVLRSGRKVVAKTPLEVARSRWEEALPRLVGALPPHPPRRTVRRRGRA